MAIEPVQDLDYGMLHEAKVGETILDTRAFEHVETAIGTVIQPSARS